jgi:hypothetical protein
MPPRFLVTVQKRLIKKHNSVEHPSNYIKGNVPGSRKNNNLLSGGIFWEGIF